MKFTVNISSGVVVFLFSLAVHADAITVRKDGTAFIKGVVIGHNSGCEVDGACAV